MKCTQVHEQKNKWLDAVSGVSSRQISVILGKATKGARWMPSLKMPMKDVENNEMLRGAVPSPDPQVSEWGNPALVMECYLALNT